MQNRKRRLAIYEDLHYQPRKKAFVLGRTTLKGIHATISDCFYPGYSYDRATIGPPSASAKTTKTKRKGDPLRAGLRTGKLVDAQLARITQCCQDYRGIDLSHFLTPPRVIPKEIRDNATARNRIMNLRRSLHKHTRAIIQALHKMHLVPIEAQVPVCNEVIRIGTAADLVCKNTQTGRLTIIEVKCGYDSYYLLHTIHNMSPPFGHINDSPHNQHQIQLGLTMSMFCRVFDTRMPDIDGFVVHSHTGGVSLYPIAGWMKQSISEAQIALFKYVQKLDRQRQLE
jgi:hypothetical protein